MPRNPIFSSALLAAVLVASIISAACRGDNEEAAPVAQQQTATPVQETNVPVTVRGCLRAGEAANTFVLTASQAEQATVDAATYQLHAAGDVDMRPHVGQRVEVSGVLRTQQEIAGRTPTETADERPAGTAGTPTVATSTELTIKQMDVNAVKPLGDVCAG